MLKITPFEYTRLKTYIEDNCGISLKEGKEYLIESRLSGLVLKTGCKSFNQFYMKAESDKTGKLKDLITDAMTTNETLWFRDEDIWEYLEKKTIPALFKIVEQKKRPVNILSAGVSTGQEAYSLLMLLDEAARASNTPNMLDSFHITGTDISNTSLAKARAATYSQLEIRRGLPEDKKEMYFTGNGSRWEFNPELKQRVQFKRFNLQNSLAPLGMFDLILCRHVIIYFSDAIKKIVHKNLQSILHPGGTLILGVGETLVNETSSFQIVQYKNAHINIKTRYLPDTPPFI